MQFAGDSPFFSGSSLEEDHEVFRLVGGVDGGDCGDGETGNKGGSACSESARGDSDEASNPRFKTEICRNFKEKGACLYGNQCQFAHGSDEMRDSGKQNKYKTKLCQKYWIHGYCAYGARCNFLHNEDEARIGCGVAGPGFMAAKKRKASSSSSTTGGGGTGDSSGEPLDWIVSPRLHGSGKSSASAGGSGRMSSAAAVGPLPPLSSLHRPTHGSGRLAAYTHNNNYTWIDTWTKKVVS
jgi:hypothetical protein